MKTLLIALSLVAQVATAGDLFYADKEVSLQLTTAPCASKHIQEAMMGVGLTEPRGAVIVEGGKVLVACWSILVGRVLILDETGHSGYLSMRLFRKAKSL